MGAHARSVGSLVPNGRDRSRTVRAYGSATKDISVILPAVTKTGY